jgi:hypothetical protein
MLKIGCQASLTFNFIGSRIELYSLEYNSMEYISVLVESQVVVQVPVTIKQGSGVDWTNVLT